MLQSCGSNFHWYEGWLADDWLSSFMPKAISVTPLPTLLEETVSRILNLSSQSFMVMSESFNPQKPVTTTLCAKKVPTLDEWMAEYLKRVEIALQTGALVDWSVEDQKMIELVKRRFVELGNCKSPRMNLQFIELVRWIRRSLLIEKFQDAVNQLPCRLTLDWVYLEGLYGLVENAKWERAAASVRFLEQELSVALLIEQMFRLNALDEAVKFAEYMNGEKLRTFTVNTLVSKLVDARRFDEAQELSKSLADRSLTQAFIARGLAIENKLAEAEAIAAEISHEGCQVDALKAIGWAALDDRINLRRILQKIPGLYRSYDFSIKLECEDSADFQRARAGVNRSDR